MPSLLATGPSKVSKVATHQHKSVASSATTSDSTAPVTTGASYVATMDTRTKVVRSTKPPPQVEKVHMLATTTRSLCTSPAFSDISATSSGLKYAS